MMSDDEVQEIFESTDNSEEDSTRGRGGRGRSRFRGRFPRRGDGTFRGTHRPFRGSATPRRFRPPRRPFQNTFSSTSRENYAEKSSKKDSYYHERHRSERRSRSRSRSTSRERRDRHYRTRSRSRSRSHSKRSRSRSHSRSPSRSSRRSPPSRSRTSPSRSSDTLTRTSRSPPGRSVFNPKTSRYFNVPVEESTGSPSTSSIVPKFLLEEQSRLPSRDKPDHRSLSPADPLESLRITVNNDYFGPTSQAVDEESEMGHNSWNSNRDDDRMDKNLTSSIEPLWKKRKVKGPRDMDAYDDDVNPGGIARRSSPPQLDPPPSLSPPPESKFRPIITQEGQLRPGNVSIFSKINQSQSWDWSQKGSSFLEETPKLLDFSQPEPDSFPGFGTSDYDVPDIKPPLRSCLRKTDLPIMGLTVKQEPRNESPPLPKYNIPGLDLVNTDDEDEFLYGDAGDSNKEKETDFLSGKSRQLAENSISARKENRSQSSSVQGKDSHAALAEYLKRIGLSNKSAATTVSSISEDAQQRAFEIAKRVTEMFNTPRAESAPAPEEKLTEPRLQPKPNQTSDPHAGRASVPDKPVAVPSYPGLGSDTVGGFRSDVLPTSASSSSVSPALATTTEQYANYSQQQSAPLPQPASYAHYNQYGQTYYGGVPMMMPGLIPPPIHPPVAISPYPGHGQEMQHFAMSSNSPFPPVQAFPRPPMPGYPLYSMTTPTTTAPAAPGWVSSLTPVQTTPVQIPPASRSNLKVIELQDEGTTAGGATTSKTAVTVSVPGHKVEEFKTPTNLMERKKLLQDRLETKKRLDIMNSQVEDCRKRQGELMRRKQRQKDGHNDPHLAKLVAAQELYSAQLAPIKKKLDSIDKALKSSEFLARKPSESSGSSLASNANPVSGISAASALAPKEFFTEKTKESTKSKSSSQTTSTSAKCRYVDNGNHWCKHCRDIFKLATDLLKHLHTKHLNVMERLAPADRPWASKPQESISASINLTLQPFQGVEFMLPSQAFYCSLCCEFSGDLFEARNHLESEKHNYNHNKYCHSNPNYLRRVQTERASSLARKKEENRRKLTETLQDNKRKIEDSLKDIRSSRHSKSSSSSRKNNTIESDMSDDEDDDDNDDSSKKKQPSTKTNIKINFLKKDGSESEENDNSSFTISTPQSKIPFKLMGKGVSTSLTTTKASKKPVPLSMEDQRAQRILSNLKKRRIQDKSERAEPLPLEDFVSIALESGLPSDCKLPEKDVQTIMAAAKELRVIPKFLAKSNKKEYGPQLPPMVEIGPQLPPDVEIVAQMPPVELILHPPPPPPGEGKVPEPLPPGVEDVPEPPGVDCIRQPPPPGVADNTLPPPPGIGNIILPPPLKKNNSQLPPVIDLDTGNLDHLSQILDAIPLPQELDDLAKKIEEGMTKESAASDEIEEVEMQDVEESGNPIESNADKPKDVTAKNDAERMEIPTIIEQTCTISADIDATLSATKTLGDDKSSGDFFKVPDVGVGGDCNISTFNVVECKESDDAPTLVIGNVTSLANFDSSKILPYEEDVEMMEPTNLSAQDVEVQAGQEPMGQNNERSTITLEQDHEPKKDTFTKQDKCSAGDDAMVQSASISPIAEDKVVTLITNPVIPQTSRDTNCSSVVNSTDESKDSSNAERLQLVGSGSAPTVSVPLQESEETAALSNGQPKAINAGGNAVRKRPQLAICSRGRGRGRGGIRSLPSCSVVIKQEIIDAAKIKIPAGKINLVKGVGSSSDQLGSVIKQEPMIRPAGDASIVAVTTLHSAGKKVIQTIRSQGVKRLGKGKVSKLKVRVKQGMRMGTNKESGEKSGPTENVKEVELAHTMTSQNFKSSIAAGDDETCASTSTKKVGKGELGETSSMEETLDDALLEDEVAVSLQPAASEGEDKLDDALLDDPESGPRAEEGPQSDISIGSMEVVDEA